jgi:hypothetical protein
VSARKREREERDREKDGEWENRVRGKEGLSLSCVERARGSQGERQREAERIIRTDLIMCDLTGSAERNS